MDNLEKIEKWIDDRLLFAGLAVDNTKEVVDAYKLALTKTLAFVQSLKAEKPQPDKGEMAYEMLMEFRNCAFGKDWGKELMRMIDFVEAKHKETK